MVIPGYEGLYEMDRKLCYRIAGGGETMAGEVNTVKQETELVLQGGPPITVV
jgi:hypothetical protein